MKKIIVSVVALSAGLLAAEDVSVLTGLNESGGLAGGALGIGFVHAVFWVPILGFIIAAGAVIGFYFKQFKQKEDGLYKTLGSIVLGIVVGVMVYAGVLKIVDGVMQKDACGKAIVTAYLQDSIAKGLNPGSHTFGTKIGEVSCLQ
ncbi:MAG: hypothetical protein A3F91_09235 [Flavobacteria bacterium RIFCSPLOWO2_12_FULL_35_11]|nr:MAG: hypothetical protein A3F91_09235 [Flavobacteria bacterium RIFCSPLOWO2_12_FULL_35_11]